MPRPRFNLRFNLRVALAAFVVAALVLTQYPMVLRRQHALQEIDNYMVYSDFSSEWFAPAGVNIVRRLCGDEPIRVIYLPADSSDDKVAEVEGLFPEASVRLGYGGR